MPAPKVRGRDKATVAKLQTKPRTFTKDKKNINPDVDFLEEDALDAASLSSDELCQERDIEDKPEVQNDDNEGEDFIWKWHLLDIEQYLLP